MAEEHRSPYSSLRTLIVRRILNECNLDRNCPSYGSFDRPRWGWKIKDFSDSTRQLAVMALLKSGQAPYEDEIFLASLRFAASQIRANGSTDQSYPGENHPQVFLDIVPLFTTALSTKRHLFEPTELRFLENALRRGIDRSLVGDEKYGVICNHLALYAYAYLLAHDVLKDERLYAKAVANINTIAENTDPEGWHMEYLGADVGYQTRCLSWLVKCLPFLKSSDRVRCEELCRLSGEFLEKTILPDGTIYDGFGSRNTHLVFPSGIEYLPKLAPRFQPLARRVRDAFDAGRNPLPLELDFDNCYRLFEDFLDADEYCRESARLLGTSDERTADAGLSFDLPNFGLRCIAQAADSRIYVQCAQGGAIVIYSGAKLLYRDAGFLVVDERGRWFGTKNLTARSETREHGQAGIEIRTSLYPSADQDLVPWKLIILRLLGMTVFRFESLSDLFRRFIVRTLMTGRPRGKQHGELTRVITWDADEVRIADTLRPSFRPKEIYRTAHSRLFHMATSRYWHENDRDSYLSRLEKCDGSGCQTFTTSVTLNGTQHDLRYSKGS